MADDIGGEPGFTQARIRTIAQIVAAALAQDRAQNQATPPSSSQPVVEERQVPDPVSDNQTSMGNTTPVENDVLKQLAELKERFNKMAAVKEKDSVTNFHITEYVLHPTKASTESEQSKRISEFEDFLGIRDEASKLVQEQKAKVRILQSVLAAEDVEETERKVSKMKLAEEKIEATPEEGEEVADANEVI
ncbi:hypothetical protein JCGZ_08261 [Jatropha curcas]|uniref:Uncharacterized protein n=1 Tax=Jatropha curcas TaxID=180498 RepID=A0A067KZ78_JATCU|nr:hypothetical protein JCGZ_08261 [Jatropha curcas]